MFNAFSGSTFAWASPNQHIIINASLVNDLMTGKYLDYQLIDWHAYKLLQDYETRRAVDPTLPKCVIFSAVAWVCNLFVFFNFSLLGFICIMITD